ncbi:Uncharacterized protein Adt_24605 [Abeliophyllum distichum]|uniref:Uncharacterized protein n=1 Tax=Abeliophyllum distichum TaxID=126358 RepID=A0ABD1SEF5_9LAMI
MEDEESDRLKQKDLLNKRRREQWAASKDYRNKRRRDIRLQKLQNEYTDNSARYRQQISSERSEGISIRTCNYNDDLIGEAVEKFFDCCAEELMHQDTMEDRPNNVPVFRTHIEDEHVVYVKYANRATIPNQTLFDVIFILDPVTVIKETKVLEFPSTNKQSSNLSISTIPGEEESDNSSVRRVLFGASSDPQEKKKQKQEESMYRDDKVTTFDSDDVDKNNYSFSDGTLSYFII